MKEDVTVSVLELYDLELRGIEERFPKSKFPLASPVVSMAKLESAVPQLGNNWATETTDSQLPVALN